MLLAVRVVHVWRGHGAVVGIVVGVYGAAIVPSHVKFDFAREEPVGVLYYWLDDPYNLQRDSGHHFRDIAFSLRPQKVRPQHDGHIAGVHFV